MFGVGLWLGRVHDLRHGHGQERKPFHHTMLDSLLTAILVPDFIKHVHQMRAVRRRLLGRSFDVMWFIACPPYPTSHVSHGVLPLP